MFLVAIKYEKLYNIYGEIMAKTNKLNFVGSALLLLATVLWGSSFIVLKQTMEEVPAFYIIAVRFVVSGIVLALVFIKKLKNTDKGVFLRGVVLGVILSLAYIVQTEGLKYTTPSRNAFLTASYCVMMPFIVWLLFKKKPKSYHVFSGVACIVGIGLIALSGDKGEIGTNVWLGDGLTLVAAVFYGLQIIFIERSQQHGDDSMVLLVMELLTVGVIVSCVSLIFELPVYGINAYALNTDQLLKIGYLTLFCTIIPQFALIVGQKFTTVNQAAVILSLEAVFGTLFSVLLGDEKLSVMLIVGFVLVFVAMLISETEFDAVALLKKRMKGSETEKEEK